MGAAKDVSQHGRRQPTHAFAKANRVGAPAPCAELVFPSKSDRVARERDLYFLMLQLGSSEEIEPLVDRALSIVVGLTGARRGYLELSGPESGRWTLVHDCEDEELACIREKISRGLLAEAVTIGHTVVSDPGMLDPRLECGDSVRTREIDAVVCAPVGGESSVGVLYLEGRSEPGPFEAQDVATIELFARQLHLLADRLLARRRDSELDDATFELRRRYRLEGVVGRSPVMEQVLRESMLAASTDVTLLISGDSGTGKTQLAQLIHANSPRSDAPFVELNCATIPEPLAESELFGAEKGSHSTATERTLGRIAAAGEGTLFLDEIGELPSATQSKLLQFLQSREYYPLGSVKPERSSARIMAATNVDLAEAVREGRLREDLYFRINAFGIRMPSLSERREDVPELAEVLLERVCRQHGIGALELSVSARCTLANTEFPGNVRQLQNLLSAGAIRAAGAGSRHVRVGHLFPEPAEPAAVGPPSFVEATRRFQRDLVAEALRETHWNVAEAARRLDLARSHVYNLIKSFGLHRVRQD